MSYRAEQWVLACCLAAIGWSVIVLRALHSPTSWLSRQLDQAMWLG